MLTGAIDMHVHCAPDTIPRKLDAVAMAEKAKEVGMKAIVLKSHALHTAPVASVTKRVVSGIRVFGGLVLNYTVGGINPQAVMAAIAAGAKIIWMSTLSARNHFEHVKSIAVLDDIRRPLGNRCEGIRILNCGISEEAVDLMVRENPARLLGL